MQAATLNPQAAHTAEPDDAALRRAWQLYKLDCWPATFEETMRDSVRAQLVRLHAHHMDKPAPAPAAPPTARIAPRASTVHAPRLRPLPPGYLDHKRAAAGDRDD